MLVLIYDLKNRHGNRSNKACRSCESRNPDSIFFTLDSRLHGNDRITETIDRFLKELHSYEF